MAKKHRKAAKREKRERVEALRRAAETRDPDVQRLPFTGRTLAGIVVNADNALQLATVWACLRYLTQTIGMLPWNVMRSEEGKGAQVQYTNTVQWLLHNRPNEEWSSFQFRETLLHWALRHGNGYAEIERDRAGRPYALWPVHPDRVDPTRDVDTNKLFFRVDNGNGEKVDIAAADMFHLRGFGEGPVGVSVMAYAAQSLGWAKALQLFGSSFFGNGANISGVVTKKRKFDPNALARVKLEFSKLYKGLRNSNQTAFLDDEMDFKPTGVDPNKAQMIEANYLMIEETCRWFGVPPHKVAHLLRATFSNIEHQSIEVVQDSVLPWVRRFEDEADFKLFGQNRQGLYTKIELRGLLRGDFKSQVEGLKTLRDIGAVNAEEIREYLDMPPQPAGSGGEKYTMQGQYTTLDKVGEDPPAPAPPQGADDEAAAQAEIERMAEEAADVA
ncbi:MAG: phage portal protein [Reyranella sp.]